MKNIFYLDKDHYNNSINPIQGYVKQVSLYLQKKYKLTPEEAKAKTLSIVSERFKDRPIKYFSREESGDKSVQDGTLYAYINDSIQNKEILVPTFTSYLNTEKQKSVLSEFVFSNVKKRSIAKKESHKAKAEGNTDLAIAKNNEQNAMKIYNNALSGVFGQSSCFLYNPTAHNTLTSVTRTVTSLGNANNEKLISGNRYLPRPIDVLNSIVYITTNADISKIETICNKYSLHLPTVEETVQVLQYSSDLYFSDRNYYQKHVIPFLTNLSSYERAAICYIGDLYHIRVFNDSFIRNLLQELTQPIQGESLPDVSVLHKIEESVLNFAHCIHFNEVKGYGKDYEKMNSTPVTGSLLLTSNNIISTLRKYQDFLSTFFMTSIFPTNSHRLSNFRRRTVVLSDTDSTCFALDNWVVWYKGKFVISSETIALAGCISFIVSQAITHLLAILSKNLNIDKEQLHTLAMKNEFLWEIFFPMEASKHYFASTVMQEGSVFRAPDIEIKGVHLKNSAVPKFVIQDSKQLMNTILSTLRENKKLSLSSIVTHIQQLENSIKESVYRGEAIYLKKSKIKSKEAYAEDEFRSPYARHTFWVNVFAPAYGDIIDPPYDVIKVPTTVVSKTALNEWLESIEDTELKARLIQYLTQFNKKDLPTIYLNETHVQGNGIPKEILSIINIKQIIFDCTMQHRLILESLGVMINADLTISEQFSAVTYLT